MASRRMRMWVFIGLGVILFTPIYLIPIQGPEKMVLNVVLGFSAGLCLGQAHTEYNRISKEAKEELARQYEIMDPNKKEKGGEPSEV